MAIEPRKRESGFRKPSFDGSSESSDDPTPTAHPATVLPTPAKRPKGQLQMHFAPVLKELKAAQAGIVGPNLESPADSPNHSGSMANLSDKSDSYSDDKSETDIGPQLPVDHVLYPYLLAQPEPEQSPFEAEPEAERTPTPFPSAEDLPDTEFEKKERMEKLERLEKLQEAAEDEKKRRQERAETEKREKAEKLERIMRLQSKAEEEARRAEEDKKRKALELEQKIQDDQRHKEERLLQRQQLTKQADQQRAENIKKHLKQTSGIIQHEKEVRLGEKTSCTFVAQDGKKYEEKQLPTALTGKEVKRLLQTKYGLNITSLLIEDQFEWRDDCNLNSTNFSSGDTVFLK